MRACVVYDTRGGTTSVFSNWIREELEKAGIKTDVKKVNEVNDFSYDIFIIGSPIYFERPLKSIIQFLDRNRDKFINKKVAIFIVCIAVVFGKLVEGYIKRCYLKPLEEKLPELIIESGVFKGYLIKPNFSKKKDFNEREKLNSWLTKLLNKLN